MRAAVLTDERSFEVRELPDPEPGSGRALVRVTACGICGPDLHMVEAGVIPPGSVLGHEPSGVVEATGDGVDLPMGTAVAIRPFEMCGTCEACRAGASGHCEQAGPTSMGLGVRPGAFCELVDVAPSQLHPLPDGFPAELGALAEPLAVALHGLRRSRFEPGATVGVIGCGPIGLCGVLVARVLGAGRIWATDVNAFRRDLAGRLGAEPVAGPADADVVLECAGAKGTIDLAMASARWGGQVVLLAVNIFGDEVYPFTWVVKEVDLLPAFGYTRTEYDEAAELLASGAIDAAAMVTSRVPLEEVGDAFARLLDGADEGKVLVVPGS